MKKSSSKLIGLLLILAVIIASVYIYFKYKNQTKSANSAKTEADARANLPETKSDNSTKENSSQKTDQNQTSSSSAQDVLLKSLNIIVAQSDKTQVKSYCTDDFYKSDFITNIISKKSSPPSFFQIISTQSKTDTNVSYQVKEEYNIDSENNAGANGTYIYSLINQDGKWLISGRE